MQLKGLSLLLLLLIPVQGYEITVLLKNYDSTAMLTVYNETETVFSGLVLSGDRISLEAGNYTLELNALNKTFIKKLQVEENQTVEFNLGFTNSTEFLTLMLHAGVLRNGSVDEVIVVTNKGNLNFEGDLAIPMPAFTNLQIITKSLDFLSIEFSNDSITFKSLLVPENESGIIRIAYTLESDEMVRNLSNVRVVIIPDAEVLEYRNLTYREQVFEGERIPLLEGNGSYYVKFKFLDYSISPIALAAILLISGSLFLVFFERRGGWKE
ncbi:MAG: hypothetical protein DSO00_04695 [Archaeoglobi archaeon]|nr:MAG: hypothetical protein DSO00_04695 [Archaeoglobi archaeon]